MAVSLPTTGDPTPIYPTPEVRTASVLFTDVRGYTGLAERYDHDPLALLEIMNTHFTAVIRAISSCEGTVEKFVGDGVLATFGVRDEGADHRERALAAALAALGANEMVNKRHSKRWGQRLEIGVGVASGRMVLGRVGSPEQAELGILGDPINVAARLVAAAAPGELLVTEDIYRELSGTVRAETLGEMVIRGRAGGMRTYRMALRRTPASY